MARGGFFGRITRAIRSVFTPSSAPPPRQPPREPSPPPPTGAGGGGYREIWREADIKGQPGRPGKYQKHLKLFHKAIDPIEKDPDEQLILWESYLENLVKPSRHRRNSTDNMFWRDSGIDPADFESWQEWREVMGFTGKNRSRTP